MTHWKVNLIKALLGGAIFAAWSWLVVSKLSQSGEVLSAALQSALATIGYSHLLTTEDDARNITVKIAALAGLLGFMGYLVYQSVISADVLVANFGALLLGFGIIQQSSSPKSEKSQ